MTQIPYTAEHAKIQAWAEEQNEKARHALKQQRSCEYVDSQDFAEQLLIELSHNYITNGLEYNGCCLNFGTFNSKFSAPLIQQSNAVKNVKTKSRGVDTFQENEAP